MSVMPLTIEIWAIVVSTKWQEGGGISYLHDGEKPWLFGTKEAAKAKAQECVDYRRERKFPPATYKPILVQITPSTGTKLAQPAKARKASR